MVQDEGLTPTLPTSRDKLSGIASDKPSASEGGGGALNTGLRFITGGARSGKSRYAQQLALQLSNNPVYLATARHWDDDFEKRIQRHQAERDERWTSIEEEKNISS